MPIPGLLSHNHTVADNGTTKETDRFCP